MLVFLGGNAYYRASADRALGVMVFTRSEASYGTISDLKKSFDLLDQVLEGVERSKLVLVFDVRKGPLRNDPVFESVSNERRRRVQAGFARRCVLVASRLGKAQIERHAGRDPFHVEVFDDPEALLYSLGARGKLKL